MVLMNGDREVLYFDDESYTVEILNFKFLPLQLQSIIKNSKTLITAKEILHNYDTLRYFFANRTLLLSRENAKAILHSVGAAQKASTETMFQLSLSCRGVSVLDNIWVKEDNECIQFADVNIRHRHLSNVVFDIALRGRSISVEHSLMDAELTTAGMFRKCWKREGDRLFMYKSDSTSGFVNTKAELKASELLDKTNVSHVQYTPAKLDGFLCCKCACMTDDNTSFVAAEDLPQALYEKLRSLYVSDFANMAVIDYLIANTDRHLGNVGFFIDNSTNNIKGVAPLFDHNQAFLAFDLGVIDEFDDLIYVPFGKTVIETIANIGHLHTIEWNNTIPEECSARWDKIMSLTHDKCTINQSSVFQQ